MVKKNFLKSSLIIAIAVAMMLPVIPTMSFAADDSNKPSITYSAHMQTYGWDKVNQKPGDALKDEAKNFAGVTGESKRMEALEVNMASMDGVTLEYRAHVQGEGWMSWTKVDDRAGHTATVGTTGRSLRVEALQLSVKGLEEYSILYRAHVQGKGWMDWVDAADPTAFAGTTGSSLRMEAFEIVIIPDNEFYYIDNNNGTHTRSYNGKLEEPEECVFGDYSATEAGKMERKCPLCGYSDGKEATLNDVLKEAKLEGQSKVSLEAVSVGEDGLTIPEGVTLEVANAVTASEKTVTVNGHLVAKTISSDATITCGDNGVITFSGLYGKTETSALKDNLAVATKKGVNVDRIVMEKGSSDQDLSTNKVSVLADSELVLDLNGTKVKSSVTNSNGADGAIENNGKLTINDGVFTFTGQNGAGIKTQGKDSELVLNNCTINNVVEANNASNRGITVGETAGAEATNVKATISNTKINMTGTTSTRWAVAAFGKDTVVNMKNVEIKSTKGALYTNAGAQFADKPTFNCDNVTIDSESTAVYFGADGTYTFNNSTIKGFGGIEYTVGTLTLNNTNVTATGTPDKTTLAFTETHGKGTYKKDYDVTGKSNAFGAALQIKQLTQNADKSATLQVNGTSKLTAEHAPAILVFSQLDTEEGVSTVKLGYPTNSVSGYTKETTKGSPVVRAVKAAQ